MSLHWNHPEGLWKPRQRGSLSRVSDPGLGRGPRVETCNDFPEEADAAEVRSPLSPEKCKQVRWLSSNLSPCHPHPRPLFNPGAISQHQRKKGKRRAGQAGQGERHGCQTEVSDSSIYISHKNSTRFHSPCPAHTLCCSRWPHKGGFDIIPYVQTRTLKWRGVKGTCLRPHSQ